MSNERYRDRDRFSDYPDPRDERPQEYRRQSDNWVGEGRMAGIASVPYDTPYRNQRPSDDFSDRNPRRDYNPYAAGSQGYGRAYAEPYGRDQRMDRHERGFMDRASDEISSWFGDEAAHARREEDHRGKGPRGYTRSDARILDDVSDRLADDRFVDASDIDVQVSEAEVTLTGTVVSREQKRRAEDCADMVSGVKHVQNNLRVAARDTSII